MPSTLGALTRTTLAIFLCGTLALPTAHAQEPTPDDSPPVAPNEDVEDDAEDKDDTKVTYDIADDAIEGEIIRTDAETLKEAPAATAQPTPAPDNALLPQAAAKPTQAEPESDDSPFQRHSRIGDIESYFTFASYARVRAATDLAGQTAKPVNVVTHGSRIDEYSYGELEFAQRFVVPHTQSKFYSQVVATLAFANDFFHFTGDFDQTMAMRNLYGDAGWAMPGLQIGFWAGSRMYRGDDIYLLDFWPLDSLNTVGGGAYAVYDLPDIGRTELKLHAGASRLNNNYQFQTIEVPGLRFGSEEIVFLDRQRFIASARLQQDLWLDTRYDGSPRMGLKLVLYGEDHSMDDGTRRAPDGLSNETLPAESGTKLGTEIGLWVGDGFFERSFVNLFYTYASDLAVYGEFGIPSGVNINKTSEGAKMHQVALSSALETPYAGALFGAYYKYFQDADRDSQDFDDYWEAIFSTRIHGYVTDHVHPGVELSYQVRRPEGPYPDTNRYEVPAITKISFIQAITLDRYMYSRPQLRFIYSYAHVNESAKALYRPEDPRSQQDYQQYLGVSVEWWFNNASLFRPK